MATINFTVGVPNGSPLGTVDGTYGYISTYTADNTSAPLISNTIFCIAPDLLAATGNSTYNIVSGISGTGLSSAQSTALEGLFSHYIDGGDTSFATQEAMMIADWTIVNSKLSVSGVSQAITNAAANLVTEAKAGDFSIDSHLTFSTFVSSTGAQSFVNVYDPNAVPLPASAGLFMTALVLLAGYALKKKLAQG